MNWVEEIMAPTSINRLKIDYLNKFEIVNNNYIIFYVIIYNKIKYCFINIDQNFELRWYRYTFV
ncbi:hypothetical protein GCM10028817_00340 [Spirosoma pomorum]